MERGVSGKSKSVAKKHEAAEITRLTDSKFLITPDGQGLKNGLEFGLRELGKLGLVILGARAVKGLDEDNLDKTVAYIATTRPPLK